MSLNQHNLLARARLLFDRKFHIPLVEPDRQISRIRLSDKTSRLHLGVQLLNRTTRYASPNENGQMYFDRALAVLSELDAGGDRRCRKEVGFRRNVSPAPW